MIDEKIIDKRLVFYGVDHFFKKRLIIKTILYTKTSIERTIYQWYIYSRPFISDNMKNNIWDYLNDYMSEPDFVLNYRYYNKNNKNTD